MTPEIIPYKNKQDDFSVLPDRSVLETTKTVKLINDKNNIISIHLKSSKTKNKASMGNTITPKTKFIE